MPHAHARCDDGPVDASDISKAADDLYRAQRVRKPIPPLTTTYGAITVDDAYQIQLANIAKRLAEGATVAGHKVGLSAKAMQRMLGVNEPDYGHLLDTMFAFENAELAVDRLLQPRVEIEVAFPVPATWCAPSSIVWVMSACRSVRSKTPEESVCLGLLQRSSDPATSEPT